LLLEEGYSQRKIADVLKRSVSTISDEIRRNKTKGIYDPVRAQQKSIVRRRNAQFQSQNIVRNKELRSFVEKHLLEGQSPESIAGRLKQESLPSVSKDSMYRYLNGEHGHKIQYERSKIRKRTKRGRKRGNKKKLQDRDFIEKRPVVASSRKRIGDCEGDFVVSGKGYKSVLLVVTDRMSRYCFIRRINSPTTKAVEQCLLAIQMIFPELTTLTLDNDILFQKHKELEEVLHIKIYFTEPYSSWQKGTVENTNKHIRKYISKGSDISLYTDEYVQEVQDILNNRFLKVLNYHTPTEVLQIMRKRKNSQE